MGRRGGLNILPQKKWNVYNWDNRIKVQRDEKLVEKEVNSIINQKRKISFNRTIDAIRKGEQLISKDNCSVVLTDKDKTKIYMDIMKRESLNKQTERKMNNDLMNKINPLNEPIDFGKAFSREEIDLFLKKQKQELFGDDLHISTFHDSIKHNLKPWYILPKEPNYKENQMLNKKREPENVLIDNMREERKRREQKEHNRILELLKNKKVNK